jgi:hypothetical protein
MRLFLAAITAAALFWLAVMVTIARIVLDNIVAVSLGVVVVAAVLIASALRRRARSRRTAAGPRPSPAAPWRSCLRAGPTRR